MKKMLLNHLVVLVIALSIVGCNNPETDGIKVAKEFCVCEKSNSDFIENEYTEFFLNIESYNFHTPAEGRAKVQEIDEKAKKLYDECLHNAEEFRRKVSAKYFTNEQKVSRFDFAFKRIHETCINREINNSLTSQIDSLIWSVFFSLSEMILVQGNGTIKDFHIGKYEVTQKQWEAVMGNNPSAFKKGDYYPVEQVSWNDVQEFLKKLNTLTGMNYRLPTSAEWEYAARGGNKSRGYDYSGSNKLQDVAWFRENSGNTTHPVGTKMPNELSIYDMSGNVWEWCQDIDGLHRATRGGSFSDSPSRCRPTHRFNDNPNARYSSLGFRLVISR